MSAPGDLGRKSLVLLTSTWTASGLGFVVAVLTARRLGPEAVGVLGFGFGLMGVLSAALLPGFAQAHMKRVAEGRDLGRCVGTMATLQFALQVGAGLIVVALWPWWPALIPRGVPVEAVVFLLVSQMLSNLSVSVTSAFIAREWAVAHAATLLTGRLVRFVATVAVLLWAPDVRWVAAAHVAESATELTLGAYLLLGRRRVVLRWPDRETLRAYWEYARPLVVTTPVGILQDSLDRVFVARWAGLAAAGYYQVARALWEVLGTLNASAFQFLFTRLAQLFARRDSGGDAEARRLFASAVDRLLFVVAPVAFGLWAFRRPTIALLYGEQFLPAVTPVMVFVVAALAQTALNPYHFVIYALEEHARFIPVVLLRFAVYLVAMAALVPVWGGTGAAGVRLLLVVFPAWVFIRWTRDLAGIGFQPRTWIYVAGFGALVAANESTRAILGGLGAPWPVALASGVALAVTTYGLVLWVWHPAFGDNLEYVRDLLHPRRLAAFLRVEPF